MAYKRLEDDECFIAPCLYKEDPIYTKGFKRDNEWEIVREGTYEY